MKIKQGQVGLWHKRESKSMCKMKYRIKTGQSNKIKSDPKVEVNG